MKSRTVFFFGALISAVATLAVAAEHDSADSKNVLQDPSFEQQLSAAKGGWSLFEDSAYAEDRARTGSQAMLNAAYSRTVAFPPYFIGSAAGSYQEFPAAAGSRWRLTGYGLTPDALKGTPAYGILQLSFFDADGNDLGTVETVDRATSKAKLSNEVNGRSIPGEWIALDTGPATAPPGTASVQAFTLYVDYSGADVVQGVYFDDLLLCQLDAGKNACD